MYYGYGSEGAVALTILEDFTDLEMVGKIFHDRESIVNNDGDSHSPNYVWWYLSTNKCGEVIPHYKLSAFHDALSWADLLIDDFGPWGIISPDDNCYNDNFYLEFMVKNGISFGQNVLTRFICSYSIPGYWDDDVNLDVVSEIIFAEPSFRADIPLSISFDLKPT